MDNLLLCVLIMLLEGFLADTKIDVCQYSKQEIRCEHSQVIMLTSARFGRIKDSPCLMDQLEVYCQASVLQQADMLCSGRRQCTIDDSHFPEFESHAAKILKHTSDCSMAYKMHLQASYRCIKVEPIHNCVSKNLSGYLPSTIAQQSHKPNCAMNWTIQAQPGQKINLTLYDFDTSKHTVYSGPMYLSLRETMADGTHKVEPVIGSSERVRHIYTSKGSVLSLQFTRPLASYFLIYYQVVGCPDIPQPEGGWIEKLSENQVKMGCSNEHQRSTLTCVGHTWQGQILNCTTGDIGGDNSEGRRFTNVLVMVVILGVAVLICTTIVIIGICCFRVIFFRSPSNSRARHRLPPAHDVTYDPSTEQMIDHIKMTSPSSELPRKCMIHDVATHSPRSLHHHSHTLRPTKQQYEQIWEEQHARTLNMKNTL